MLGSDVPIENLRSGFGPLYAAYDEIFSGFSGDERAMSFHRTAERWMASPAPDARTRVSLRRIPASALPSMAVISSSCSWC